LFRPIVEIYHRVRDSRPPFRRHHKRSRAGRVRAIWASVCRRRGWCDVQRLPLANTLSAVLASRSVNFRQSAERPLDREAERGLKGSSLDIGIFDNTIEPNPHSAIRTEEGHAFAFHDVHFLLKVHRGAVSFDCVIKGDGFVARWHQLLERRVFIDTSRNALDNGGRFAEVGKSVRYRQLSNFLVGNDIVVVWKKGFSRLKQQIRSIGFGGDVQGFSSQSRLANRNDENYSGDDSVDYCRDCCSSWPPVAVGLFLCSRFYFPRKGVDTEFDFLQISIGLLLYVSVFWLLAIGIIHGNLASDWFRSKPRQSQLPRLLRRQLRQVQLDRRKRPVFQLDGVNQQVEVGPICRRPSHRARQDKRRD
jgi:hypothetical protein